MPNKPEVILKFELLAHTPEFVAEWLEKSQCEYRDAETEMALINRKEPLITLALAKYCYCPETAQHLLEKSKEEAIILSVLSNRSIKAFALDGGFPASLFGGRERMYKWLSKADIKHIHALLQNPELTDSFLTSLLDGKEVWNAIKEDYRAGAISALAFNERMMQPYDRDFLDGWTESSYASVFNKAWKLSETVPVNDDWASVLSYLYQRLVCEAYSIKDPLSIAKRWYPAKESQEESKFFDEYFSVRKGLGKLALAKNAYDQKHLESLLNNEDPAIRAAAYAHGQLTADQILAAYKRDEKIAFENAIDNEFLWRKAETQNALHTICNSVIDADPNSDLLPLNEYRWAEKRVRKEHPEWFHEEEDEQEQLQKPATKEDLKNLQNILAKQNTTSTEIKVLLNRISIVINALLILAGAAIIYAFFH